MTTNVAESFRGIVSESSENKISSKLQMLEQTVYKNRKQEIELFLALKKTATLDQIVKYLEMNQQYEEGLGFAFFPEIQSTHRENIKSKIEMILTGLRHRSEISSANQYRLSSQNPQLCNDFLQKYTISAEKSILLLRRLYLLLQQRSGNLEITISEKLDKIEQKAQKTRTTMMCLLRIAEYMRSWSLQFIQNPDTCDLSEFSTENFQESNATDPTPEEDTVSLLVVDEKKEGEDLFEQYQSLVNRFNKILDACIGEVRDFKELSELICSGGRLERLQLRAEQQEMVMKATTLSSSQVIDRWKTWRDEMVTYLRVWRSKSSQLHMDTDECDDIEMGGHHYAK